MQENVQVSKGEVSPSLQYLSLRRRSPSKLSLLRSVRVFPLPPLREPPQRPKSFHFQFSVFNSKCCQSLQSGQSPPHSKPASVKSL